MGSNAIIRPVLRGEISKLHSMRYLCWKHAYGHIYGESEIYRYFRGETQERRTWPDMEYEHTETLTAEMHGTICGYAKLGWDTGSKSDCDLQTLLHVS